MNGEGKLLIPLIRSRSENNRLSSFPVEVVYATVQDRFSALGSRQVALPPVDLLTSQVIWSVYLPNDYAYIHFSSTLEKEEMIRGVNIFAGAQRRYDERAMKEILHLRGGEPKAGYAEQLRGAYEGKDHSSRFRNLPLEEDQISTQLEAEAQFNSRLEGLVMQEAPQVVVSGAGGGAGILPIQIQVPTGGQVYRFARTIVRAEDPLTMSVNYASNWMMDLLKWIILLLILLILFLNRRILSRALRGMGRMLSGLQDSFNRDESTAKRIAQSLVTPFVLLGLLLVSLGASRPLAALVFFLLWISVVYQVVLHRRRRAEARAAARIKPDSTKEGD
jgi:hypothetical protein